MTQGWVVVGMCVRVANWGCRVQQRRWMRGEGDIVWMRASGFRNARLRRVRQRGIYRAIPRSLCLSLGGVQSHLAGARVVSRLLLPLYLCGRWIPSVQMGAGLRLAGSPPQYRLVLEPAAQAAMPVRRDRPGTTVVCALHVDPATAGNWVYTPVAAGVVEG